MAHQRSEIIKTLHAVKSVFHAVTAIRGARDHESATHGLGFRHYVIGAAISALLIITLLLSLVKLIVTYVAPN